jgi:hypothetical protein
MGRLRLLLFCILIFTHTLFDVSFSYIRDAFDAATLFRLLENF